MRSDDELQRMAQDGRQYEMTDEERARLHSTKLFADAKYDNDAPVDPDKLIEDMERNGLSFTDGADFMDEDIPPPEWIVQDFIGKGMKGDLFGKGKTHKTFLAVQLAEAVAMGGHFLKWNIDRPRRVAYFNLELMPYFMQERMRNQLRAKKLAAGMFYIFNLRGRAKAIREHQQMLKHWIRLVGVDLVVIDPRYKLMEGDEDENTAAGLRAVLDLRDQLLEHCAVLLVGHDPKGDVAQKSKMDRGAGSYTAGADCDFAIYLTPHEDGDENHVVISTTNRNRASTPDFSAIFDCDSLTFTEDGAPPITSKPKGASMTSTERAQRNSAIADAFKTAALEVADAAGDSLLGVEAFKAALRKLPGGALGVHTFDSLFKTLIDNGTLKRQNELERTPDGGRKNKYRGKTFVSTPERIETYLEPFDRLNV